MRRTLGLLAIVLASACLDPPRADDSSATPAPDDREEVALGTWTTKAVLPTPRTELACAVLGNRLYAVGGFNAQAAPIATVEAYDLARDTWTRVLDYPLAVHHLGIVAHKGALYGFGGHAGTQVFVATSSAFRYDPATNTWSPETNLPRPRGAFAIALQGDDVYLVGGTDSQSVGSTIYATTDVYNLTTKQWRAGPALTDPREHFAGGSANETLVVAGGRKLSFMTNTGTADSLVRGATQWASEARMPTARGGVAAASWRDEVVVFGGEASSGTFNEAEGFNVTTKRWVSYPPMPSARHGLCAATAPDGIHVVGGGPEPAYTVSGHHEILLPGAVTASG